MKIKMPPPWSRTFQLDCWPGSCIASKPWTLYPLPSTDGMTKLLTSISRRRLLRRWPSCIKEPPPRLLDHLIPLNHCNLPNHPKTWTLWTLTSWTFPLLNKATAFITTSASFVSNPIVWLEIILMIMTPLALRNKNKPPFDPPGILIGLGPLLPLPQRKEIWWDT